MNIDPSEFLSRLRPTAITGILDRKAGITPEQRLAINEARRAEELRLSARAKEIIKGLSDDDIDALHHYFGDGA